MLNDIIDSCSPKIEEVWFTSKSEYYVFKSEYYVSPWGKHCKKGWVENSILVAYRCLSGNYHYGEMIWRREDGLSFALLGKEASFRKMRVLSPVKVDFVMENQTLSSINIGAGPLPDHLIKLFETQC